MCAYVHSDTSCRLQPGTQSIDILTSTPPSSWRRPSGRPPLRRADQIIKDTHMSLSDAVTATHDRPCSNNKFYSFVKHNKTEQCGIAPLKHQGLTYSDPVDKSNNLSRQFESVFSNPQPLIFRMPIYPMLNYMIIDELNISFYVKPRPVRSRSSHALLTMLVLLTTFE